MVRFISLITLFGVLALLSSVGPSQSASASSSGVDKKRGYAVRNLKDYIIAFPPQFSVDLANLNSSQVLLDSGSGEAYFDEQYLTLLVDTSPQLRLRQTAKEALDKILNTPAGMRASAVALDYGIKRNLDSVARLKVLIGRYFEDLPDTEIGPVDFIADLYGVFAYSSHPDEVLRRYWHLLRSNGVSYVLLSQSDVGFAREDVIHCRDGIDRSLLEWLVRLQNSSLSVIDGRSAVEDYGNLSLSLRMEKSRSELYIPKLELISTKEKQEGGPPIHVFLEK